MAAEAGAVTADPDASVPRSELSSAFRLSSRQLSCLDLKTFSAFPASSSCISNHIAISLDESGFSSLSSHRNSVI